jgi:hypothetical protein
MTSKTHRKLKSKQRVVPKQRIIVSTGPKLQRDPYTNLPLYYQSGSGRRRVHRVHRVHRKRRVYRR